MNQVRYFAFENIMNEEIKNLRVKLDEEKDKYLELDMAHREL